MRTVHQVIDDLEALAHSTILPKELRASAQIAEAILRQLRTEMSLDWGEAADDMYRKTCNLRNPNF